jgi:hypothetical protein
MQPSITALTTVPASRVSCAMSSTWCCRLYWRTRDKQRRIVLPAVADGHFFCGGQRAR